jgi:DnaJ domain
MNIKDALNLLGLTPGHITPADVKAAYRKAISLYHPDRNPAGLEMTQLINKAYEVAQSYEGEYTKPNTQQNYDEAINQALNAIINLGLTIEVCGAWVWVSGNTKPHKDILKQAGFQWAPKKMQWYFRPEEYKSRRHDSWSLERIRAKYGSEKVDSEQRHLQAAN